MAERKGAGDEKKDSLTQLGENYTLAHLENRFCAEEKKDLQDTKDNSGVPEKDDALLIPGLDEESSPRKLPNAQRFPTSLSVLNCSKEDPPPVSGYLSAGQTGKNTEKSSTARVFGSLSMSDDMESLCQEELEDAFNCAVPRAEEEVLNSLKALPNRITRMEEQWRETLREVQRFNAHTSRYLNRI